MSAKSCVQADFINPRNAAKVSILEANAIPVTTAVTVSTAVFTANASYNVVGKFAQLHLPTINFTGSGSLISATLSGITGPYQPTYWPLIVNDAGTRQIGIISLSGSTLSFSATTTWATAFTSAQSCTIYPISLVYTTSS
jgi:hypothetical protein